MVACEFIYFLSSVCHYTFFLSISLGDQLVSLLIIIIIKIITNSDDTGDINAKFNKVSISFN